VDCPRLRRSEHTSPRTVKELTGIEPTRRRSRGRRFKSCPRYKVKPQVRAGFVGHHGPGFLFDVRRLSADTAAMPVLGEPRSEGSRSLAKVYGTKMRAISGAVTQRSKSDKGDHFTRGCERVRVRHVNCQLGDSPSRLVVEWRIEAQRRCVTETRCLRVTAADPGFGLPLPQQVDLGGWAANRPAIQASAAGLPSMAAPTWLSGKVSCHWTFAPIWHQSW